jgi:DNA-binding MarR family transcriptional regulator
MNMTLQPEDPPKKNSDSETRDPATLGALDHYIGFNLLLAQNASFKAFKRRSGEDTLKPGWFAVLSLIRDNPGITPMSLSRLSGRDKSTMTPVLRNLRHAGLIARGETQGDKRSYRLTLTASGEAELKALAEHARRHDEDLDVVVGDRKEEFLALLRSIAAHFD